MPVLIDLIPCPASAWAAHGPLASVLTALLAARVAMACRWKVQAAHLRRAPADASRERR